ncbi:hypothetical protein DRN67_01655 [Candidatus Micrarchaeota archaeon]|nr:MAG: hypothetical protein DRN67_01655 [Candidatus Micrarchaeota archaeon]
MPALKANIAKELYEAHDMNQVEIAKKLGLTQAAVSKYLSKGVCKRKEIFATQAKISKAAKRLADAITTSKLSSEALAMKICEECLKIHDEYECIICKHIRSKRKKRSK